MINRCFDFVAKTERSSYTQLGVLQAFSLHIVLRRLTLPCWSQFSLPTVHDVNGSTWPCRRFPICLWVLFSFGSTGFMKMNEKSGRSQHLLIIWWANCLQGKHFQWLSVSVNVNQCDENGDDVCRQVNGVIAFLAAAGIRRVWGWDWDVRLRY